jgi:hypothetical protein
MVSKIEKSICSNLRSIFEITAVGSLIDESETLSEVLSSLEFFIPSNLRTKYKEWKHESLDGIYVSKALITGQNQMSFIGMCILITNQGLVPIYAQLKVSDSVDDIEWMDCKLAEVLDDEIIMIPYSSSEWRKRLYKLDLSNVDLINWRYSINYRK